MNQEEIEKNQYNKILMLVILVSIASMLIGIIFMSDEPKKIGWVSVVCFENTFNALHRMDG